MIMDVERQEVLHIVSLACLLTGLPVTKNAKLIANALYRAGITDVPELAMAYSGNVQEVKIRYLGDKRKEVMKLSHRIAKALMWDLDLMHLIYDYEIERIGKE